MEPLRRPLAPGSEEGRPVVGGARPSPRRLSRWSGTCHTACLPLQGWFWTTSATRAASPCLGAPACTMGPATLQAPATPQTAPTGRARALPSAPRTRPGGCGQVPRIRSHLGPRAEASGCPGRRQGAPVYVGRQAGLGEPAVGLPSGWGLCLGPRTMPCPLLSAPAPEAGGPAGRRRVQGPAPCWAAPTSPRSTESSTQCTGTAATCWPRCGPGPSPTGGSGEPRGSRDLQETTPALGGRSGEAEAGRGPMSSAWGPVFPAL